jgi:putative addiction module CopG family antidote
MLVDVPLSPYMENFVRQAIASGRYASAERLFASALSVLEEQQRAHSAFVDGMLRELRDARSRKSAALMNSGQRSQADHVASSDG